MTETVGQALDVDALRRRYAEERARRLRADGIAQYGAPTEYADILEQWRADGDLEGLLTRRAQDGP